MRKSGQSRSATERHERPLLFPNSGGSIENGTSVSTQQATSNNQVDDSLPLTVQDDALSALIGAGKIQEYQQFLQTWTASEDHSEKLPRKASQKVPLAPRPRLPTPLPETVTPAVSNNTLSDQAYAQSEMLLFSMLH